MLIIFQLGEISLMYLYLRNQFGFNEINFSLFSAYTMVIMLLGKISKDFVNILYYLHN